MTPRDPRRDPRPGDVLLLFRARCELLRKNGLSSFDVAYGRFVYRISLAGLVYNIELAKKAGRCEVLHAAE